jgi:SsrA-binding protein
MNIKIVTENKKARFDYSIIDTYEAGLVLMGSEIKSIRQGNCSLKDSYVAFVGTEAYVMKMNIAVYQASSYNNHEPERRRKLLLGRVELDRLEAAIQEKGFSCIPLKVYLKNGYAKIEIALAKGKTKGDKRDTIKTRDANREIQRSLRQSKR